MYVDCTVFHYIYISYIFTPLVTDYVERQFFLNENSINFTKSKNLIYRCLGAEMGSIDALSKGQNSRGTNL